METIEESGIGILFSFILILLVSPFSPVIMYSLGMASFTVPLAFLVAIALYFAVIIVVERWDINVNLQLFNYAYWAFSYQALFWVTLSVFGNGFI